MTRQGAPVTDIQIVVHGDGPGGPRADQVPTEEPLLIRIEHGGMNHPIAVTMRTPGDDVALAVGFLFTEGIVERPEDILEAKPCAEPGPDGKGVENVVQVLLRPDHPFDPARFSRNFYTTSSCGVCGKTSIDAVEVACEPVAEGPVVSSSVLRALPERLRKAQAVFATTGGLHASALFTPAGELLDLAEDVGRHNATDKVIGRSFRDGRVPLADTVLVVSGRVSFEIVQKAARAGIPFVAALGAPSSLAVDTAQRLGTTLVGFLSPDRFNTYNGDERIR